METDWLFLGNLGSRKVRRQRGLLEKISSLGFLDPREGYFTMGTEGRIRDIANSLLYSVT